MGMTDAFIAPLVGTAGGIVALGAINKADRKADEAKILRERNISNRQRKLREMAFQLQRLQAIWAQLVRDDPQLAQRLTQNPQGALALMQDPSLLSAGPIPYQA